MLIYLDKRYVPTDLNMMVIEDTNGKFYYIHRSLYDQAVILSDKFCSNPDDLLKIVVGPENYKEREDVKFFFENVPEPINILGAFLALCPEEFTELEDMVGAIHVMSGPINFRKTIQVPHNMRNEVKFSMHIKNEYQLAWDRFKLTVIDYDESMFLEGNRPMNGTNTIVSEPTEVEAPAPATGDDGLPDNEEDLMAAFEALMSDTSGFDTESDENKTEETTVTEEAPAPANNVVVSGVPDATTNPDDKITDVEELDGINALAGIL